MPKLIEGQPITYEGDAPGTEPDFKPMASKMLTTCPACLEFFKQTNDFEYMGKHAKFTGLYAVRDADNLPYRIYFCQKCESVFASRVHFKQCPYKNEIIEYDTELGYIHYVTCLEPHFECDKCRKDLATHHWVCQTLDDAPFVRFVDVYNDPWFNKMERELVDEELVNDREAMKKWVEEKKLRRR